MKLSEKAFREWWQEYLNNPRGTSTAIEELQAAEKGWRDAVEWCAGKILGECDEKDTLDEIAAHLRGKG